jgi:hypothetical protein
MPAMMRRLSSYFEVTRMWRSMQRRVRISRYDLVHEVENLTRRR